MISLVFFMFSLVFVHHNAAYLNDTALDIPQDRLEVLLKYFGTVQDSMLTLYMAATGGIGWAEVYDVLQPLGFLSTGLFLFFIAFWEISLMNVLIGIFVENAIKLAEPDRQFIYAEHQKSYLRNIKELEEIVKDMDSSVDGQISQDEFSNEMLRPHSELREYLGAIGVHSTDAERFFYMLKAAHFGKPVGTESLVAGLIKLPGVAQSLDVQALLCELKLVHRRVLALSKEMKCIEEEMQPQDDPPINNSCPVGDVDTSGVLFV